MEEMIMRLKRFVSLTLAALMMVTPVFTGCGSSKETSSDGKITVKIGTQQMPNDEGIAKALNYFQEEMGDSVTVEIVEFSSGKDVNTALAAGSIDFGLEGSCPAALAIAQDLGVELIWIHEVLGDVESLAATSASGVKNVSDLKGKTIAVPFASTAHFSVLKALENAGLSTSDVTLLDMQPDKIYASWNTGDIDAAYIWEPTLSELADKTIVTTSGELAKAGYMTSNVEVVRTKFAEAHPDIVAAYVKALNKAVELYNSNESTAVSTIASALELTQEDAKFQMSGSEWLTANEQISADYLGTSSSKGAIVQNLYDTAEFLKEQGSITKVPDKSVFENAVNPKYIEMALGK
jgi:taurine transport system substrate-binding protein